ncbi:efflux RND transporter periplasmic adaptor subunit, partial [Photobacterium sp. OFAV2-7]|uniref:efflux RND transporter periplasmic adaptor subunit n=1 Tax=Photobacterium sp. OFAV2-7 TaxID=2917748 RepID=UPI00351D171F|nr:hypothetical protein [Photobacterium sp. OFAV2-7]
SLVIKSETEMPDIITLELDAAPDISIPAKLLEFAGKADPATQTFEVRYSFKPPKKLVILPGMTGTLTGEFSPTKKEHSNTFSVPLSSIVADGGETYVWVLDQVTMTVSRRNVHVTPGDDNNVSVSNLEPGEVIISAGANSLYEGVQVRQFKRWSE